MNKLKNLTKVQKIVSLLVVICLIIGSILVVNSLTKSKDIFYAKDNKDITIEYGNTYKPVFKDLVKTKSLNKEEIKELKKEVKITSNIKNEKDKEYPAVGKYKITFSNEDKKFTKLVYVKDTTAPVFDTSDASTTVTLGNKDFDFNTVQGLKASDLSGLTVTFDLSKVDFNKEGDYDASASAKDPYENVTTKGFKVTIKKKEEPKTSTTTSNVQGKVYQGGGKIVCIDAGHQARGNSALEPNGPGSSVQKAKVTTGASGVATGNTESSINLNIAIKLKNKLVAQGYTVVMCRESQNVNISNAERATIANNNNANAFIRIHCDSSNSSAPTGTMTMAPTTSNPYCANIAARSQVLAQCVLNNTCAVTGSKNRGVSKTDTMTGLNWSKVPVTIIECGFLSNPNEDRLLSSDSYQDKLATGMSNGIGEFLK
ncbi:MAG: N-acetylmuramoyl-L-alanine amidase [Thomasclavelia sp.]|nr:N-acetylmuramoyl-L-alanine amidase [Thomasclavelia sp.]